MTALVIYSNYVPRKYANARSESRKPIAVFGSLTMLIEKVWNDTVIKVYFRGIIVFVVFKKVLKKF